MKKSISILLISALLCVLLAGCSKDPNTVAGTGESSSKTESSVSENSVSDTTDDYDDRVVDNPYEGYKFTLPDAWYTGVKEETIILDSYEYGLEVNYLSEEGKKTMSKLRESIDDMPSDASSYSSEQEEMIDKLYDNLYPVCMLLVEYDGNTDSEMRKKFTDEKQLGESNNTVYTMLYNKTPDTKAFTEADKALFESYHAAIWDIEKDIAFSGKKTLEQMAGEVSFDTKTIEGLDIDTSILIPYKLTAINIWATWCGPCVAEMPDLQKVYENLPEGVNFLGVCLDGGEETELAKQILSDAGVKYENMIANDEMNKGFMSYIQGYPTTIFVDSKGNLVGDELLGAPTGSSVSQGYLDAIDERLKLLDTAEAAS